MDIAGPHYGPLGSQPVFMALWIAIGVAIGAMLGVTVFDNVRMGMGIAFSIPIGLADRFTDGRR